MSDLPDGSYQFVPSAQIDMVPGFSIAWGQTSTKTIVPDVDQNYTFTLTNATKVYQISSIAAAGNIIQPILIEFRVNNVMYWCAAGNGYCEIPAINNPSLKFTSSDQIVVRVHNHGTVNNNIRITICGTMFVRPLNFGLPPVAQFSVSPLVASINDVITFTDESNYLPTSYTYEFGDSSAHSHSANPTHQYAVSGRMFAYLTASNIYGSDQYWIPVPVGIANTEDYTTYVLVDGLGLLTVLAGSVTFTNVTPVDVAYAYFDFGVDYFYNFEVAFGVNVSASADGSLIALMYLSNGVSTYGTPTNHDFLVEWKKVGSADSIVITLKHEGGAVLDTVSIPVSLNTPYYIRIYADVDNGYYYYWIYSNAAYTTLLYNGIINNVGSHYPSRRYLYACCSKGVAGTAAITGVVSNLRVITH